MRTFALLAAAALLAGCSTGGDKAASGGTSRYDATIINDTPDQIVYASMWQGGGESADRIAMVKVEPGQRQTFGADAQAPVNLRVDPTPDAAKPTDQALKPGKVTIRVTMSGDRVAVVPGG